MSVTGLAPIGGAELGTSRKVPSGSDFYAIARTIEEHRIDALMMIGGYLIKMNAGFHALPNLICMLLQSRRNPCDW